MLSFKSLQADVRVSGFASEAEKIARLGTMVILALFLSGGLWMVFAPLSGAVIAAAHVKVDLNRKTLQHQEGGIVKEILVRDGSKVKAGEVLLVLGDVRVDTTNELLKIQLESELAKAARLDAERALDSMVRYPAELTSRTSEERIAELIKRENAVFSTRRNVLGSQVSMLQKQIREAQKEGGALTEQLGAEERALRSQKEEFAANEALAEKGFINKTRLLALERSVADYESRRGERQAQIAQSHQRAGDFELRIVSLQNQYMQQATDELKETTGRINDLRERLRPSLDAAERQRVVAPVSGEVVGMRVTSVGSVIGPREPLLDIVPENPELIVEAKIRPEDILYVRRGGQADVKLTAYKSRTTPVVQGDVVYVSADRMNDPATHVSYYIAQIKLSPQALKEAGDLHLQAGMPAEVFVRTGARTALEYLLEPISAFVQHAFREP